MIFLRMELKELCERFEIAVANFGRSCIDLQANEPTFQAWYAASVIQEFGMLRVYREVHCNAQYLEKLLANDLSLPKFIMKHEIKPDLSVSWKPKTDTRHTETRIGKNQKKDEKSKQYDKILQKFAIVSELKVTGSTANVTESKDIKRDLEKLRLLAHAHHAESKEVQNNRGFATYSIILDNHCSAFVIAQLGFDGTGRNTPGFKARRIDSNASHPCNAPEFTTLRTAANNSAPHNERIPFVTRRKITDHRIARSLALFVAGTSGNSRNTNSESRTFKYRLSNLRPSA